MNNRNSSSVDITDEVIGSNNDLALKYPSDDDGNLQLNRQNVDKDNLNVNGIQDYTSVIDEVPARKMDDPI